MAAAIAGTVTLTVWAVRVLARTLHLTADLLAEAADLADRARGRAEGQPAAASQPAAPVQPALTA
jgi:hypothetical protein